MKEEYLRKILEKYAELLKKEITIPGKLNLIFNSIDLRETETIVYSVNTPEQPQKVELLEKQVEVKEEFVEFENNKSKKQTKKKLKVVFKDGTKYQDKIVKDTFLKTVQKVGIEKIYQLMQQEKNVRKKDFIIDEKTFDKKDTHTKEFYCELQEGFYIRHNSSTSCKKGHLEYILKLLKEKEFIVEYI